MARTVRSRLRRRGFLGGSCLAAALVLSACGSSDQCGDPLNLRGDWAGTIIDRDCGGGALAIVFTQQDCSLHGTWAATFAQPFCDQSGSVDGHTDSASMTATLSPASGCGIAIVGVIADDRISGNYRDAECTATTRGGTFDIRRTAAAPTAIPVLTVTPALTATPLSTATPAPTATAAPTATPAL